MHLLSVRNAAPASPGRDNEHATTTVIIAVVCVVGGLLTIFIFYRILRRSWTPRSAPFPPVQPIAHYREQQLAELVERANRSPNCTDASYLGTPLGLSPSASDCSLLKALESEGYASHRASFAAPENQRDLSPVSINDGESQAQTAALAETRRASISSLISNDSASRPVPSTPRSITPSSPAQSTFSRPIPRSRPSSQIRPRPLSTLSTTSVRSSRNGVPHGPHSQVKIVLPAPLAPALQPYIASSNTDLRRSGVESWHSSARTSMVDVWTPALHRSASSHNLTLAPSSSRSFNQQSPLTYAASPPRKPHSRRSPPHTSPSSYNPPAVGAPPVPPIPSWCDPGATVYAIPPDPDHSGMSNRPVRDRPSTSAETSPPRQSPSSPLRQSHKLRKRSRSQSLVSRVERN
ncbi:hypothetical protein BJ138DRAFT_1125091 [Hygrophoropsis aurantiaca]|uniref:Uncharacterized protein n=1 Tax=Hygrophoropsis aurantiaca TaxID=72124 RepID=A0ACB8AGS7_9AGAM|nr:hypothetical protein BJ138DRAFT_1125091 [Hygrophoropsis aurantiaca]